jgi:ABC-type dipeptide/oligopeptide/nickel transport system ATPase component
MTDRPIIEIEDLAVSFPVPDAAGRGRRFNAVQRVNLSVYPAQTLAVVGESGSGKSVSAMSILQLIPTPPGKYESGRILWAGSQTDPPAKAGVASGEPASAGGPYIDLLKFDDKQMRKVRGNQIAMIFQEPMTSLNPVYTIGDQITEAVLLHQQVSKSHANKIAADALRDVGIADPEARLKEYPHQLSGGMRQRVMIAMALACQPKLLLADEPTTALDVTIQAQILELLRKLQDTKQMAVLLITHDLGVVAENADVVAVMYAGRVVEYASVFDLFQRPMHPYTRGLLLSMPVLGKTAERLPTVMDGATVPEDFPAGYKVAPHTVDRNPPGGYGGEHARLYEVQPNHWVLCEPTGDNKNAQPTPPRLAFRRPAPVASV